MQKNNPVSPRSYYDTLPLTMAYYTATAVNLRCQNIIHW